MSRGVEGFSPMSSLWGWYQPPTEALACMGWQYALQAIVARQGRPSYFDLKKSRRVEG